MNPARTFGPAACVAQMWDGFWVYFIAPPLGMLAAAEVYVRLQGAGRVACAKLHHQNEKRCIFCRYSRRVESRQSESRTERQTCLGGGTDGESTTTTT